MLRVALTALTLTGCLSDDSLPSLDATSSAASFWVHTTVNYGRCDGAPCTGFRIELSGAEGGTDDAVVSVVADNGEPFTIMRSLGGSYEAMTPGWIERVHVDATLAGETAWFDATSALTTPDESNAQLPDTIVLGSHPTLRWNGQHAPYSYTLVYGTLVPAPRIGFLEPWGIDDGAHGFDADVLTTAGRYNFSLVRSIDYHVESQISVSWESTWNKAVDVVEPPAQ